MLDTCVTNFDFLEGRTLLLAGWGAGGRIVLLSGILSLSKADILKTYKKSISFFGTTEKDRSSKVICFPEINYLALLNLLLRSDLRVKSQTRICI